MLLLHQVVYTHPNRDILFDKISLAVDQAEKIALIGNNGTGKSTLLRLITGELTPSAGHIKVDYPPYYVPQIFGQFDDMSIAQALNVETKLTALREIMEGHCSDRNYELLNDDWQVEDRVNSALRHWDLAGIDLSQKLGSLSGGQKTRVFLAGMMVHQPRLVLLDEPSNHLDLHGRNLLYDFIGSVKATMIVVSHDRRLLNQLTTTYELSREGLNRYGGNYEFYLAQKKIESEALLLDIQESEKSIRKAREKERHD